MARERSTKDRFRYLVCSYLPFWWMLAVLNIIFSVLLVFSLIFMDFQENPAAHVIALIDAVVIVVTIGGLFAVIRMCNNFQENH